MSQPRSIHELATPVLLLDWPASKANIDRAAAFVADRPVRLRPHFKNHKCVPLAKEQIAAGGCVGFTTATLNESEVLLNNGIDDILIANQIAGEAKIDRFVQLSQRGTVRVTVDDIDNARAIGTAALQADCDARLMVEIDIGNSRCGIPPGPTVVEFVRELQSIPGIVFDGLHAYHGHAVNMTDAGERERTAIESMQLAIDTRRTLEAAGIECAILSGMGTSTHQTIDDLESVDELQMGTYVTMDWCYKQRSPEFELALTVLSTVISARDDQFVLDVGVKGVGDEYGPPQILGHPEFEIPRFKSEEHTIVKAARHSLQVGDPVRIVPSHSCATCNLHERIVVHEGDQIRDIWPIEGRGY
jgi:D-serine deaminase-like pyridoxal phosphate-dependent protein